MALIRSLMLTITLVLLSTAGSAGGVSKASFINAIKDRDAESINRFMKAGINFNEHYQGSKKAELFRDLIEDNDIDVIQTLLINGAELEEKKQHHNSSWPPLYHALAQGKKEMAMLLIPYSDPQLLTQFELAGVEVGLNQYPFIPKLNGLFLAQLCSTDKDNDLEEAILNRINTLGGEDAVQISKLQAVLSASDMAYADGNISDASKLLNLAPQKIDTNAIANSQNISLVNIIKHMLAARDELLTMQGGGLREPEDQLISELTNAGNSTAHLHAMFKVIKLAKAGPYKSTLREWEENFKGTETWTWDYSKLNAWIESQKDESIKMRMLEALEYFEFNLNASK